MIWLTWLWLIGLGGGLILLFVFGPISLTVAILLVSLAALVYTEAGKL